MKRIILQKGSYTVEAAFIVPVILGIIFAMLYLMFFFHDKVVLRGNMEDIAVMIMETDGTKEMAPLQSDEEKIEYLQRNMWLLSVTNAEIKKKGEFVCASIKAEREWKIPVMQLFLQEKNEVSVTAKYRVTHPEKTKRFRDLLSSTKKEEISFDKEGT